MISTRLKWLFKWYRGQQKENDEEEKYIIISLYDLKKLNLPKTVEYNDKLYQTLLSSVPSAFNFQCDNKTGKISRHTTWFTHTDDNNFFQKYNTIWELYDVVIGNIYDAKIEINREMYKDLLNILKTNENQKPPAYS